MASNNRRSLARGGPGIVTSGAVPPADALAREALALSRRRRAIEAIGFLVLALVTAWSATVVKSHRAAVPLLRAAEAAEARPERPPAPPHAAPPEALDQAAAPTPPAPAAAPVPAEFPADTRWFDAIPHRPVRTVRMRVTAYSPDAASCAPFDDGYTATMNSVWTNGMRLVAADPRVLPMGSRISVPGYHGGEIVPVLDKGGLIKGRRLDVLYPTHDRARAWGVRDVDVTIWEPIQR